MNPCLYYLSVRIGGREIVFTYDGFFAFSIVSARQNKANLLMASSYFR